MKTYEIIVRLLKRSTHSRCHVGDFADVDTMYTLFLTFILMLDVRYLRNVSLLGSIEESMYRRLVGEKKPYM